MGGYNIKNDCKKTGCVDVSCVQPIQDCVHFESGADYDKYSAFVTTDKVTASGKIVHE